MKIVSLFEAIAAEDMSRTAMPAAPNWWQERSQVAPYAYHNTPTTNFDAIRQKGLVPWDDSGNESGSIYDVNDSKMLPRANSVYFHNPISGQERDTNYFQDGVTFRADLNNLNPQNIIPDEDAIDSVIQSNPNDANLTENKMNQQFDINQPGSFGQLADEHGYGNIPDETHRGIGASNTFAHRGQVPPENLHFFDTNSNQYVHVPSYDSTIHQPGSPGRPQAPQTNLPGLLG